MTPAMVVPVFHAEGGFTPLAASMALRFTSSKSKPPALEPASGRSMMLLLMLCTATGSRAAAACLGKACPYQHEQVALVLLLQAVSP
jgi:hypothetical protein